MRSLKVERKARNHPKSQTVHKSARSAREFDNQVIDGAVDGLGRTVTGTGGRLRFAQRGQMQQNMILAFAAIVLIVLGFVAVKAGLFK